MELLKRVLSRRPWCLRELRKMQDQLRGFNRFVPNEESYLFLLSLQSSGEINLSEFDEAIRYSWLENGASVGGEDLLIKYGFLHNEVFLNLAISKGYLRLVKSAESELLTFSDRTNALVSACSSGNLELLKYLYGLFSPIELPQDCIPNALYYGGLPMVKFLHENGCKRGTLIRKSFGWENFDGELMALVDPEALLFVEEHYHVGLPPTDLIANVLSHDVAVKLKRYLEYYKELFFAGPFGEVDLSKIVQQNLYGSSVQVYKVLLDQHWFRIDVFASFKLGVEYSRLGLMSFLFRKYPSDVRRLCASIEFEEFLTRLAMRDYNVSDIIGSMFWLMRQGLWLPRPESFFYPYLFDKVLPLSLSALFQPPLKSFLGSPMCRLFLKHRH